MTQPLPDDPHTSHPLLQTRKPLAFQGRSDDDGQRRDKGIANCTVSMQQVYQRLNTTPKQIGDFCEKWKIDELALFGSILRDDFRPEGHDPSDVDVLYTQMPKAKYGFEIFDMKEELETLFARKVDFVSRSSIQRSRNWLRRQAILESEQVIYAKKPTVTD
jgi:uncharacterized protein